MFCPRCGLKQWCPCKACDNKGKCWIWINYVACRCANCGLTKAIDWWMDLNWEIHKEEIC